MDCVPLRFCDYISSLPYSLYFFVLFVSCHCTRLHSLLNFSSRELSSQFLYHLLAGMVHLTGFTVRNNEDHLGYGPKAFPDEYYDDNTVEGQCPATWVYKVEVCGPGFGETNSRGLPVLEIVSSLYFF